MAASKEWLCKVLIRDTSKALLHGGLQMMGELLGDAFLKVLGMHRKVQIPKGVGEVESTD